MADDELFQNTNFYDIWNYFMQIELILWGWVNCHFDIFASIFELIKKFVCMYLFNIYIFLLWSLEKASHMFSTISLRVEAHIQFDSKIRSSWKQGFRVVHNFCSSNFSVLLELIFRLTNSWHQLKSTENIPYYGWILEWFCFISIFYHSCPKSY